MVKKCGIYKYTNLINGKVYIGQSTNIAKRNNYHYEAMYDKKDHRYKNVFYCALRKYGFDNFKLEVLEECPKEKLNEREVYYIKLYNSCNRKYGYNMTQGGDVGEHYVRNVCQIDPKSGEIVREFNSVKEANNFFNTSNIGVCCKNKTYSNKGFLWRYLEEYDKQEVLNAIEKRKRRIKTKQEIINGSFPVGQFTLDGELVAKFQTKKEASEQTGISYCSIMKNCNNERPHAGGYIWKVIGKRGQDISTIEI